LLSEIRARFGPAGLSDYAPAYGRLGAVTDDTQMTLFTAEGLVFAGDRLRDGDLEAVLWRVYEAYLRWFETQGEWAPGVGFGGLSRLGAWSGGPGAAGLSGAEAPGSKAGAAGLSGAASVVGGPGGAAGSSRGQSSAIGAARVGRA
jgi:ADP-ribosyl-[dinitrogen reductase] hydrolase